MNLHILEAIAELFKRYKKVSYIGREGDNLIKLSLDNQAFFIDLAKSRSAIFCCDNMLLGGKAYKAPFDFALQKYCLKANIITCNVDGNNRILLLKLHKKLDYKEIFCTLCLEFTGKYTNAIIVDSNGIILESLRKITQNKRIIKNGISLTPLPQQEYFNIKEIDFGGDILAYLYLSYQRLLDRHLESIKSRTISSLQDKKARLQILLDSLPSKDLLLEQSKYYANMGNLMQNNMDIDFYQNPILLRDYDGKKVALNLDDFNSRSASSLINECFAKAKKLILKSNNIAIQKANLRDNIAFLDSKIAFIKNAKNIGDIDIISQNRAHNKNATKPQYESFFINGTKISLGKNKHQNIALLKDARANDIWMHIRGIPSSHLIIHCSKSHIREEILRKAAEILVEFCAIKIGNFDVDYTKRRFVKIKEGANVNYANYLTITIRK